jgi:predicted nucleic acid-binding protein
MNKPAAFPAITTFLDTSVLITASDANDRRHAVSQPLLAAATPATTACGAHTLAEVYAVLSRLPGDKRLRPNIAGRLIEQITERMTVVPLTVAAYAEAIHAAAQSGLSGGIVYDALLLACARKVDAQRIYTWNRKHFQMVAPDLADRILTP